MIAFDKEVAELAQLVYLLSLNRRLFNDDPLLNYRAIVTLLLFLLIGSAGCLWPVFHIANISLPKQALVAGMVTLVTLGISYRVFRVDEVRAFLWQRIRPSGAA